MQFMDYYDYSVCPNENLFKHNIGDTLSYLKNGLICFGYVRDRSSIYTHETISLYYIIEDFLLEENDIINNSDIILLEIN